MQIDTLILCALCYQPDPLSYSKSGVSGPYSSSPVCLEDVRLCLEAEKKAVQGLKSSSLTNINQKGEKAGNRRRSLPGTPTHGRNEMGMNKLAIIFEKYALFTFVSRVR